MRYVLLYFLIGAVTAVWTALNQARFESENPEAPRASFSALFGAYLMIGLAWPLSVVLFVYGLVSHLLTGAEQGDG